jgi:hypothetical protein
MATALRRIGTLASISAAVVLALPAAVWAECNGPVCGEPEQGLDAFGVVLLVAVLVAFVAVMTVGSRMIPRDRRSND